MTEGARTPPRLPGILTRRTQPGRVRREPFHVAVLAVKSWTQPNAPGVWKGFFLVYVNDMVRVSRDLEFVLFADDTNLFAEWKDPRSYMGG